LSHVGLGDASGKVPHPSDVAGPLGHADRPPGVELVERVLRDQKFITPVSTEPGAAYGIHGISLGVPAVLGRRGVEKVWKVPLTKSEMAKLKKSADLLKGYYKGVK